MNRYLLFINQLYAYSILRPLQRAIRDRGDACAWLANGIDDSHLQPGEERLTTVGQVKAYDPVAVFVPGNWVPNFFPGVKVQLFHGLANDQTGKKGHYRIRELFDLYCTHAPVVTREFERLAERHGTFRVAETGWPKLDPLFRPSADGPTPAPGDGKPVVLYASTFSPSLTSAPVLLDRIAAMSTSGRWSWLVTLHPKTPRTVVDAYRSLQGPSLRYVDGLDVLALLRAADVMLCDTSSIALEFMMLDKPVVTFRTKVPGPHVLDVTDLDELEPAIGRALERPAPLLDAARAYVDALHPYRDGKSSERVLAATDAFVAHDAGTLARKPLNLWRKLQIRKRMRYWRLR